MVPTYTVNEIRNCVNFAFRVLETENNGMIRVNFVAAEHILNHNPFLITQRSYPMQSPVLSSGPRSTRSCGGGEAELARGLKRVKEILIFFLNFRRYNSSVLPRVAARETLQRSAKSLARHFHCPTSISAGHRQCTKAREKVHPG